MEDAEKNLINKRDRSTGSIEEPSPSLSPSSSPLPQNAQSSLKEGYEFRFADIAMKIMDQFRKETKKEVEDTNKRIKTQEKSSEKLNQKIEKLDQTIHNTELRSIEVIGIISAIIALVLIFVDTANAQRSLKDSYSILVTGTASLILFASLLHHFFNKDDKRGILYYVLFFVIPLLVIIVIGYFIFK